MEADGQMAEPIRFGVVGSGWRTAFFARVARSLPDRFQMTGLLTRDPGRAVFLGREWGVPGYLALDDLLADRPLFVVVSVPWAVTPVLLRELAERGVPVLSETPPAPDVDGLIALRALTDAGARIQVAEQYQFQPLHAARLAIAASGRLGTITQAQVSTAHGHHGIDLMRRLLEVPEDAAVAISARWFTSALVAGPDRNGPPSSEHIEPSTQVIAQFDFDGKLGILDFTDDQYFSWIRSNRTLVRGERGEINDMTVRYLEDVLTPLTLQLTRHDTGHHGNLEGYYHRGIMAGSAWVYRNPYIPARLADDEIAVATCLDRMADYIGGGPDFCSLAEAVQDHYLTLLMEQAATSGQVVRAAGHVWS